MTDDQKSLLLNELTNWVDESFPGKGYQETFVEHDVTLDVKLLNAVHLNGLEEIDRLLEIGADPYIEASNGLNAIQLALVHGREKAAKRLIDHTLKLEEQEQAAKKKSKPKKS